MFKCEFCQKPVKDKGAGFRFFVEYPTIIKESRFYKANIEVSSSRQLRICWKCLKTKNYEDIKL